jgi:SAM-dependent methyltransferase
LTKKLKKGIPPGVMNSDVPPSLRIYTEDSSGPDPFDPHVLATRELMRLPEAVRSHRDLEPLSRGWFEEIELKRYLREGEWLPRLLEFSRHKHESMLMISPGLGTDAIQYDRHGTEVTIGVTDTDPAEALRQNFDLRGRHLTSVHVDLDRMPFHPSSFDLAYVNALHPLTVDLPIVISELYRVLKPGGKLFGLFPARCDVRYWQIKFLPFSSLFRPAMLAPGTAPGLTARELKSSLTQFENLGIWRRHLRRSELPLIWRFAPMSILERLMGHVLIVKAFKPISSAVTKSTRAA